MQIQSKQDVIIIGGGVYGVCIAYYLNKTNPELKINLLEQFTIGHNNGSSHSPTRITRSTYEKEIYRDLNLKCLTDNWPELETSLKQKLVYDTPFVYYDDLKETYLEYQKVAASKETTGSFKFMSPEEVTDHYKHMPLIPCKNKPIVDTKAGIIAADTFLEKLKNYLVEECPNITISEHTTVRKIMQNENEVNVETQNQILRADKVIVASGKWALEVLPELSNLLKVVKQFMGYLQLQNPENYEVGKFPCFAFRQKDTFFFSLPDRKNLGVKFGHHNLASISPQEDDMEFQHQFIRQKAVQIYGSAFVKINSIQVCYYTVTKTSDFILDYTGPSEKIFVCSCCSGHAYKFAPIIGQIISEIVTSKEGRTMPLFEKWSHLFKIPYHMGVNLAE